MGKSLGDRFFFSKIEIGHVLAMRDLSFHIEYFNVAVSWVVTPCSLADRYQRFGETRCANLQSFSLKMEEVFSSKHWYLSAALYGCASQKTIFSVR